MPLLKFDLIAGRSDDQLRRLLDTAHQAMVEAFQVPQRDRYQSVVQHRPGKLIFEDTGLGYTRTNDVVLLMVTSRPRSEQQKTTFYRLLAERLESECKLAKDDLIICMVENGDADWSFGHGGAQFLTKEL